MQMEAASSRSMRFASSPPSSIVARSRFAVARAISPFRNEHPRQNVRNRMMLERENAIGIRREMNFVVSIAPAFHVEFDQLTSRQVGRRCQLRPIHQLIDATRDL